MADGTCSVEGCSKTGKMKRGWCSMHYQRFARHGAPDASLTPPREACSVENCAEAVTARGLCAKHYTRLRNRGTTDPRPPVPEVSAEEKKARKRRYHATERAKILLKQCRLDDCARIPDGTGGMCASHARRLKLLGDPYGEYGPRRTKTRKPCSVDECQSDAVCRTWCFLHWQRWRKHGDPLGAPPREPAICGIDDCTGEVLARGYCTNHYARWNRFGDPRGASHKVWSKPVPPGVKRRANLIKNSTTKEERSIIAEYRKAIIKDPCLYCGGPSSHGDHYYPLGKGGKHAWWALVPACSPCNLRKHARCGTWFALKGGTERTANTFRRTLAAA